MFHDPIGIVAVLLIIEAGILGLSEYKYTRRIFDFVPSLCWIYFLPILANTFGIIPKARDGDVYDSIIRYVLPGCLVLLLVYVDVPAILKLGWRALLAMLIGSLGIVLGGPIVLMLFKPWLPADIWMGLGPLSASWTGGSANMIAVKAGLGTPQRIYSLMVVVDSIVPYLWMSALMALSRFQPQYDKWNKSDAGIVEELSRNSAVEAAKPRPTSLMYMALMLALAAFGTFASLRIGGLLPEIPDTIKAGGWVLIAATVIGIALSFTPARKLEQHGASKLGYAMLYLVLGAIGAQADLAELGEAPLLIGVGIIWVIIHAGFTILGGRLLRAPMSLLATASQANIGGVASTPVVAGKYHPRLVSVGLLLAIFGNIIGTYLGFLCAGLCKFVSR